jgi:hypothetical protein
MYQAMFSRGSGREDGGGAEKVAVKLEAGYIAVPRASYSIHRRRPPARSTLPRVEEVVWGTQKMPPCSSSGAESEEARGKGRRHMAYVLALRLRVRCDCVAGREGVSRRRCLARLARRRRECNTGLGKGESAVSGD